MSLSSSSNGAGASRQSVTQLPSGRNPAHIRQTSRTWSPHVRTSPSDATAPSGSDRCWTKAFRTKHFRACSLTGWKFILAHVAPRPGGTHEGFTEADVLIRARELSCHRGKYRAQLATQHEDESPTRSSATGCRVRDGHASQLFTRSLTILAPRQPTLSPRLGASLRMRDRGRPSPRDRHRAPRPPAIVPTYDCPCTSGSLGTTCGHSARAHLTPAADRAAAPRDGVVHPSSRCDVHMTSLKATQDAVISVVWPGRRAELTTKR